MNASHGDYRIFTSDSQRIAALGLPHNRRLEAFTEGTTYAYDLRTPVEPRLEEQLTAPDRGSVLICAAKPKSRVVIDV